MKHQRALGALTIALVMSSAACGSDEPPASTTDSTVIEVSMTDNEFTPNSFDVAAGEAVTFRFTNDGTVDHEAIIGTEAEQADHESEMTAGTHDEMDGMDHGGSDATAITVQPGGNATLTHTFDTAGSMVLGCHEPGHYAAGMKAMVHVT